MKWGMVIGLVGLALGVGLVTPLAYAQQQTSPGSPPTGAASSAAEVQTRITERKTRLNTQLTDGAAASIKNNCQLAQTKITTLSNGLSENVTSIHTTLNTRVGNLQRLRQYADTRTIDTQDYVALSGSYKSLAQSYLTAVKTFGLSMGDLKSVDCVADPVGFKATLDSARNELTQVNQLEKALSAQNADLLPAVKKLKTEFEK